MITLPHKLCPEAIFTDSLDLIDPGLSMLQLNLPLSYRQRLECVNGIVDTCAFKETTTNNFCR